MRGEDLALNVVICLVSYPEPGIHEITVVIRRTIVFSRIEITRGYHENSEAAEYVEKTAIPTDFSLY